MNAGDTITFSLAAGHVLTITGGGEGSLVRLSDNPGGPPFSPIALLGADYSTGPFASLRRYALSCHAGELEYSAGVDDPAPALHIVGEGAPEDAVQASLDVNPEGDDNGLTFTAVAYGAAGNDITIEYIDPGVDDADLAVEVEGTAIRVFLATDGDGVITSTAADVLAAIEESAAASRLVTVEIDAGDAGDGDDGSGEVTEMAAAALENGAGTGIGLAVTGCLYSDSDASDVFADNGKVYRNSGTITAPVWTLLGDAA